METKHRIIFTVEHGTEQTVDALPGESLLDAAKKAGIPLDAPCGGKGTCGKCRVKVHGEWQLACTTFPSDNLTVLVPETAGAWQNRIRVSTGTVRENTVFQKLSDELMGTGCGIELITLEMDEPTVDNPMADRERLLHKLGEETGTEQPDITLHALRKLPLVFRQNDCMYCVVRGDTIIDIFPGSGEKPIIAGLAIDIGTTTVSALLVDLGTENTVLASGSAGNAQIRYGADVISRIIECGRQTNGSSGLERLRHAIIEECLVPLITRLCQAAGICGRHIYRAAIAANTTMTHLCMGVDPSYLRLEPYVPAFFQSGSLRGADVGLPIHPEAELITAPAVGSYVGGDISAGVFASMLHTKQELSLLVDLGTNGELVLGNAEFLMTCACSAGPAFEGGDISCGMRATDGAIEACTIDPQTMEPHFTVIGSADQQALGLCGSGLIDLVGELFRCQIIDARGKFIRDGERVRRTAWGGASYMVSDNISLNEADIDNFIRAKGAIFSAIQTMLASLDFDVTMLEKVYIAGGIGSGINIQQAIRIGMLPNIPLEQYHYIGNSSLHGAWSMLVSQKAAQAIDQIGRSMTYIELSTHPSYMDELIAACFLPHTNGALFATA